MGFFPSTERQSSLTFLLDVNLFVRVRLQVLQTVRLTVDDLVRSLHEPEEEKGESGSRSEDAGLLGGQALMQ